MRGWAEVTFAEQHKLKVKHNAEIVKQEPLNSAVPSIACGVRRWRRGGGI